MSDSARLLLLYNSMESTTASGIGSSRHQPATSSFQSKLGGAVVSSSLGCSASSGLLQINVRAYGHATIPW